jgi:glycosyltransferase involved in cell wall biosynthesis
MKMQILLLNPFHGGSHAAVAEGYARHSRHQVTLLTLPIDGGWRWRMRGGAVTLARLCAAQELRPDLILGTDMLDLATFLGLTRSLYGGHGGHRGAALRGMDGEASVAAVPVALYFHENQLTYPLPPGRARDLSFAWTNYTSAMASDALFFNSNFHRRSFLAALPDLLGRYHDNRELESIAAIAARAQVLAPGIDLARHDRYRAPSDGEARSAEAPIILWNSRWEYDKQPQAFFAALDALAARGVAFRLIVAGEHIDPNAAEFVAARERWSDRIVHWGYAGSTASYSRLLWQADIVVSTALQEFFGIGVIEALYCGCVPLLPRRLSYPELIPAEYHPICLYDTPVELVERLQEVIGGLAARRALAWRAIAAPYDWSLQAAAYDAAFEALI